MTEEEKEIIAETERSSPEHAGAEFVESKNAEIAPKFWRSEETSESAEADVTPHSDAPGSAKFETRSEAETEAKTFVKAMESGAEIGTEEEPDAEEEAALAGFSDDRDAYGREILERTFPNLLLMSETQLKIDYSRLKNAMFAYRGMKSVCDGATELVKNKGNALFRFAIEGEKLSLTLALPFGSIDKKVYPHKKAGKEESGKELQTVVSVTNRTSRERAVELIALTADTRGIPKNEAASIVPYAEAFPVNRNAVLRGDEEIPPVEGQYDGAEYEDVSGGILREIEEAKGAARPKGTAKKGKDALEERRQTAGSVKAAVALEEPIVYYYDVAVDKEDKPLYVNVRQVLNDKFLGKLLPEQFFAVAEGSDRIEKFNFCALEAAKEDAARYAELLFCVTTSVRLLLKRDTLKRLLKFVSGTDGRVVLALDCALLEASGGAAAEAVRELRAEGAKILLDNSEQAGMRALTDFDYEFLRFDARYYREGDKKSAAHLDTLANFAKTLGIASVASKVETVKEAVGFLTKSVAGVEGFIVEEPKRIVQSALKERKKLPAIRG